MRVHGVCYSFCSNRIDHTHYSEYYTVAAQQTGVLLCFAGWYCVHVTSYFALGAPLSGWLTTQHYPFSQVSELKLFLLVGRRLLSRFVSNVLWSKDAYFRIFTHRRCPPSGLRTTPSLTTVVSARPVHCADPSAIESRNHP